MIYQKCLSVILYKFGTPLLGKLLFTGLFLPEALALIKDTFLSAEILVLFI